MNDVNRMHSANRKDHSAYGLNTVIRPVEIVVQCCASVLRRAPCPKLAHLFALANLASSNAFALAPSARLHLLVGLATTQRLPINSKACLLSHRSLLVNYLPLAPVSLTSSFTPQSSRPEGVQPSALWRHSDRRRFESHQSFPKTNACSKLVTHKRKGHAWLANKGTLEQVHSEVVICEPARSLTRPSKSRR